MESFKIINVPERTIIKDGFDGSEIETRGGVGFMFQGQPVRSEKAFSHELEFDKSFQFPLFKSRDDVTYFLMNNCRIPRGTGNYNKLYKQLTENIL